MSYWIYAPGVRARCPVVVPIRRSRHAGADTLLKSAQRPEWWANPDTRYVQCRTWLDAGYNAFLVKGAEKVRFERC